MDTNQLAPLAQILLDAYQETHVFSREFTDHYGSPPTVMAKAHFMRSVVQSQLIQDEHFQLASGYLEFGRVQVTDLKSNQTYLLRSHGAFSVESWRRQQRGALFDANHWIRTDTTLLVYEFHGSGLDLSLAGAQRRRGGIHVEASSVPVFVNTWPYLDDNADTFSQDTSDAFGDLGDLDLGEDLSEK